MDILVFGAGAVGSYLGGNLALAGHQVTLVTRQEMADAVNLGGLRLTQAGKTRTTTLRAVTTLPEALNDSRGYDLVIMAMKSYDLASGLDLLATRSRPAQIMGTQNGIGVEEMIAARFDIATILAGAVTAPVSRVGANQVIIERQGRGLGLAPVQANRAIDAWQALFSEAGIYTVMQADFRAMKWSKAFLNIVGNATSAILNRPPGELYRQRAIFNLEMRMLSETLAVMDRLHVPVVNLPGAAARPLARSLRWSPRFLRQPILARMVARGRGDKMPSFHMDLCAGKGKSEVQFHNGAIAAAGETVGLYAPVNRALNDILMKLTSGELERQTFDGRPDRLLATVAQYERVGVNTV